jgi:hypothetical protein
VTIAVGERAVADILDEALPRRLLQNASIDHLRRFNSPCV